MRFRVCVCVRLCVCVCVRLCVCVCVCQIVCDLQPSKRSDVRPIWAVAPQKKKLLPAGRFGDRIPVGATYSAPVHTGPGVHPASFTMSTGSLPEIKRPARGVDHPPPSSAEVKERVELYIYSLSGSSWPILGRDLVL